MDKWEIDKIPVWQMKLKSEIISWNYRQEWLEFQKRMKIEESHIFKWVEPEYSYKSWIIK
jgi:hypothetical protein